MLNSFRLFLLVVSFVALGATNALAEGKKYAVLVGVNEFQHENLPTLKFAERDVAELAKVLEPAGYVVTLLSSSVKAENRKPTRANIEKQLKAVLKGAAKGDTILIALSGHGLQFDEQRDAFFCPLDARPFKDETKSLVSLGELYQDMEKSFAGMKVLLVDACRNDPGARGRSGINGDNAPRPPQGVAALFSCKAGEKAFENDKLQHGVFFHHVLEGLRGKAVTDGEVTFAGLANYVSRRVAKDVPELIGGGAKQSPNLKADYSIEPVLMVISGSAAIERKPGEIVDVEIAKGVKMEFCWIPGGETQLGSPDAERQQVLKLANETVEKLASEAEEKRGKFKTKGFWLAKYEVTQEQWRAVMASNSLWFSKDGGGADKVRGLDTSRCPAERVSWNECQDFIKKLNEANGVAPAPRGFKGAFALPREDEWEYACRGGKGNHSAYYFGEQLSGDKANCDGSYPFGTTTKGPNLQRPTIVGSYEKAAPHPWGLCDMHGNVGEWCESVYSGSERVVRGGSFFNHGKSCRSALRSGHDADSRSYLIGFRLARVPSE